MTTTTTAPKKKKKKSIAGSSGTGGASSHRPASSPASGGKKKAKKTENSSPVVKKKTKSTTKPSDASTVVKKKSVVKSHHDSTSTHRSSSASTSPTTSSISREKSTFSSSLASSRSNESSSFSPSRVLILLWLVTTGELLLDLVSTVISFIALVQEGSCCGESIDMGGWPLGITIPFLILILLELALLLYSIRLSLNVKESEAQQLQEDRYKRESIIIVPKDEESRKNGHLWFAFLNALVLINPFFGSLVAWVLLYQSSQRECFVVLGLEGLSLILHWVSVKLENPGRLTWCMTMVHSIPLIPFTVTVIIVLVYLQEGGVCYLVESSLFWYSGCQVCLSDGMPPNDDTGLCSDGTSNTKLGSYCEMPNGDPVDDAFCFFAY